MEGTFRLVATNNIERYLEELGVELHLGFGNRVVSVLNKKVSLFSFLHELK